MITIVGLGPGSADDITRGAWRALEEASALYLRTSWHPAINELERDYQSFDSLYEAATDFEAVYSEIVETLLEKAKDEKHLVYAVPGHPLMGEQTVTLLLEKADPDSVKILDGISYLEPSLTLLGVDGIILQLHDAAEIAQMYHPPLNPDQPALLGQIYSRDVASHLKLTLMNQYPDEHPVILLHGAGTPDAIREELMLYEIDRSPHIAHMTTLYLPPLPTASSFAAFQETIAHLRSPEDGCPWDIKQTHQSLRRYLLEETYEVLEALDAEDYDALADELGDLLLQVVLHSQVAIDEGNFTMNNILAGVNAKIIRRHPHVWGDEVANDEDDLQEIWLRQKEAEKSTSEKSEATLSILDGIPPAFPALMHADKIQRKAAKVGFDWDDIAPVVAKISEEIDEINDAPNDSERAKEMGDLLFAVVNWARWLEIDPEIALREANLRFSKRFRYVEAAAGEKIGEMTLDELDKLWEQAKTQERHQSSL